MSSKSVAFDNDYNFKSVAEFKLDRSRFCVFALFFLRDREPSPVFTFNFPRYAEAGIPYYLPNSNCPVQKGGSTRELSKTF